MPVPFLSRLRGANLAFGYRSFRTYQLARFLMVGSMEMLSVAVGWQLYDITHRPLDLGLAGLVQFLPAVLLLPWTGHAADCFPRQNIARACAAGFTLCALCLLGLSLLGSRSPLGIYVVLFVAGVVRAFMGPAGQSLLPLLVARQAFPNAVAWGSAIFQSANILGPAVGGFVYAGASSPTAVYACCAGGLSAALLLLFRVVPHLAQTPGTKRSWPEILAGFRFVWKERMILGATTLDLLAVLLGGAVALLPVYAREILDVGPWGLGLLRAAPGVGAVAMAIGVALFPLRRHAGPIMLSAVTLFGLATVVFGLSRSLPLSLAALVVVGAADMVSVIVRGTLVQLRTPDHMRGRVSAVNMLFIGASNELGQFESGVVAQFLGPVSSVLVGGIGSIATVGFFTWRFPELRRIDRLQEVKEGREG